MKNNPELILEPSVPVQLSKPKPWRSEEKSSEGEVSAKETPVVKDDEARKAAPVNLFASNRDLSEALESYNDNLLAETEAIARERREQERLSSKIESHVTEDAKVSAAGRRLVGSFDQPSGSSSVLWSIF